MNKRFSQFVLAAMAAGISFAAVAQTAYKEVPKGWHLKDQQTDGYYGISLDKAYDFVKGKKSNTVIVAIIDSGVDTTHEDLKSVLWTNPKEIPGNGIDDDGDGYVDDVHGWNFLGGKDGRNVNDDSYEGARVYHQFKDRFQNITDPSTLSKEDQDNYAIWKKAEKEITGSQKNGMDLLVLHRMSTTLIAGDSILRKEMGKDSYTGKDLDAFTPTSDAAKKAKTMLMYLYSTNNIMDKANTDLLDELKEEITSEERKAEAATTPPKDYRGEIVKDNPADINDRFYGNNDVMAGTPLHGTHVSGIIGADRTNGIGINGIADNVKIMMLRAVPNGDEHDKDIAEAIRFAADHGAKVVNMSFGKSFSPQKKWIDDAVKYADSKGVLLVHAAGNDAANNDSTDNFPNPHFKNDTKVATNWITVGASGDPKIGGLVASFSNYGKNEVDVFAPGVDIYSTLPVTNKYGNESGTSMASPVVAGVAAFILEYYPNLTPEQVKYVIEKSAAIPVDAKAINPATNQPVSLSELSKSGGIVNAYNAIRMADAMSKGGNGMNATDTKIKQKGDKMKVKEKPVKAF